MAATNRGWPLPEQTTNPPDVVKAITDVANAADADVEATNDRILYGPEGSVPTLDDGQMYLGY
jgi:hypothetical protein